MKRFCRSMLGVTLLEIMLVLAIAAMIIVMSVRYYQSANASQQANNMLEMIQAITAAGDGIAQAQGNYSGVTTAAIQPLMPNGSFATPWGGGDITIEGGAAKYTVSVPKMPASVCSQVAPKLAANNKFKANDCPSDGQTWTYTYGY